MVVRKLRVGMLSIALASAALCLPAGAGHASGHKNGQLSVSCANGVTYPLLVHAATEWGEAITGTFVFSRKHHARVRLVPMGEGYRYAGHGFWLDGIRSKALLHVGHRQPVPCDVTHS